MKKATRIICVMAFCLVAMMGMSNVSSAATVGKALKTPEAGWTRYDDTNSYFNYEGTWGSYLWPDDSDYYLKTHTGTNGGSNNKISFKFKGTKFRMICENSSVRSSNIQVKIDGSIVGSYSLYTTGLTPYCLVYESADLNNSEHTVELLDLSGIWFTIDAVDIYGSLLDYNQPKNLIATPGDSKVILKWSTVKGATDYIVKRSTVSGGPYTEIASGLLVKTTDSTASIIDNGLSNNTTYYYIVSAVVSGKESSNSIEVSATPKGSVYEGNSAILEIVMTNGAIKEYSLTNTELESFLDWYDNRSDGVGKSYYRIPKKSNVKPFLSRKEYLSFDKIYSFEVKDYNE